MNTWLRQHWLAMADAVRHLRRSPGSFAWNALVVAIALMLPFTGLTVLESLRPVSGHLAVEPEISIFMAMSTPRDRATALTPRIHRILQDAGSNGKLEFIPREQALGSFKNRSGMTDALTILGENPLPDAYVLKLGEFRNAGDTARIEAITVQLKSLPGVEYVQVDSAWVKRLTALMRLLQLTLLFLAATLGVVVVAVVFNTIRLQVMTHQDEIEVCRLLGATNTYICRPFYYTGALLGLFAGAAALGVVGLALQPLNAAIAEFSRLYGSEFRLIPLTAMPTAALLTGSAALGLAGALLSVRRHLSNIA